MERLDGDDWNHPLRLRSTSSSSSMLSCSRKMPRVLLCVLARSEAIEARMLLLLLLRYRCVSWLPRVCEDSLANQGQGLSPKELVLVWRSLCVDDVVMS